MTVPARPPVATSAPPAARSTSYPDGVPHAVSVDDGRLSVRCDADGTASLWSFRSAGGPPRLEWIDGPSPSSAHVLAALDGAFMAAPTARELTVAGASRHPQALWHTGVFLPGDTGAGDTARAGADLLWQQPRLWLPQSFPPMAPRPHLTGGRYHPIRPPKLPGTLYRRHIPWLGRTLSFRSLDPAQDLEHFHRWMNDPDVAKIWDEAGDRDRHRAYLAAIDADPHMQSMIASLDDEPFGYFETYWAKESRIAPFYDADDHDRGWHVLIGEAAFRGKAVATAWLTSISHYLFLGDPRTRRAVGEPRIDHVQQIRNLDRSGYAKLKEFDLPHKRALLVVMLRERYFADACWLPRDGEPAAPSQPESQRNPSW